MKNVSFALLALFIVLFSSCEKEEELSISDKLVGVWKYEYAKFETYENGELVDNEYDDIEGATLEFKRGGIAVATFANDEGEVEADTTNWILVGEDEIILEGGDPLKIKTLTDKELVTIYEETEEEDGIIYLYIGEVGFAKQYLY